MTADVRRPALDLHAGVARVAGGNPLRGRARVPGDKSISHRGLILAALAEGRSELSGLSDGDDVGRTRAALAALGVGFGDGTPGGTVPGDAAPGGASGACRHQGDGEVVVVDGGRGRLAEPERPLDLGNSGTGMRLLAGLVATLPHLHVLLGDESLSRRPMGRIAEPLRAMGARVDGRNDGSLPPLVIRGGNLRGIEHEAAVASAQVKGCLLLAGLDADGETVVRERLATRRHTEELLALAGAPPEVEDGPGGYAVRVRRSSLRPFRLDVPGDPSQAAFLVVAACLVPGSDVVVENVYLGPGRAGFLAVLQRMGADVEVVSRDGSAGDVRVRGAAALRSTEIGGEEVPDLIDEVPVLAVAAAAASGTTVFRDAAELRAKESDRIATMAAELGRLGVQVEELPDGMVVHGLGGRPAGAAAQAGRRAGGPARSHGDHRVAMALCVAALAGLAGDEPLEVGGFDAVATSWPGFLPTLAALGGEVFR